MNKKAIIDFCESCSICKREFTTTNKMIKHCETEHDGLDFRYLDEDVQNASMENYSKYLTEFPE